MYVCVYTNTHIAVDVVKYLHQSLEGKIERCACVCVSVFVYACV